MLSVAFLTPTVLNAPRESMVFLMMMMSTWMARRSNPFLRLLTRFGGLKQIKTGETSSAVLPPESVRGVFWVVQAYRLSGYTGSSTRLGEIPQYDPQNPRCTVLPLGGRVAGSSALSHRN